MSLSVDGVWKAGAWATTVWADGVWREGAAVAVPGPIEGAGSGKYRRKPEDWEVIAWLEAMFPPVAQHATESRPVGRKARAARKRTLLAAAPPDYSDYTEALAGLERLTELYQEWHGLEQAESERRKTQEVERKYQRIRAKVAALVGEYVRRQKDDESALVIILGEVL